MVTVYVQIKMFKMYKSEETKESRLVYEGQTDTEMYKRYWLIQKLNTLDLFLGKARDQSPVCSWSSVHVIKH